MSQALPNPMTVPTSVPVSTATAPTKSFVHHAKLISLLTLGSRILGVVRESLAARFFGAGLVTDAFTLAFAMPNLFRRLFGEGALSAAFIPLYSQAIKTQEADEARKFAAASVNLLIVILATITVLGEAILLGLIAFVDLGHHLLAVKLTAIMFPYVLLVCGTAFLGAILNVHKRFGMAAAVPMVLNVALIGSTVIGAMLWNTTTDAGKERAIYFVSFAVVIAGVVQAALLVKPLKDVGFRFDFRQTFRTPAVKKMIRLSIPVAIGAGVLQLSTLLDKGLAYFLAQGIDESKQLITHFTLFGQSIPYPLERGAAVRLSWAQLLYQFPLGVFAIALATAIFPTLSADAMDADREKFRAALRKGMQVTLWEGLPASVGLIIVALPAAQVIFQSGQFTYADSVWVARSLSIYAIAVWAFSLQQIVGKAYYALHDTWTPLAMSVVTLFVNVVVEIPLMWTPLKESGMAVGTAVSFIVQALVMLWLLQKRVGGLGMKSLIGFTVKVAFATALMALACWGVSKSSWFPADPGRAAALARLILFMTVGGAVYLGACEAMGVGIRQLKK